MRSSFRLASDVLAPAFFICWTLLFAHDAVMGATGLRALKQVQAEAAAKASEVAALEAERRRLERIAAQLNPRSLDPDLADEKIRAVLGYVGEGDVVIARGELDEILRNGAGG